MSNLHNNKYIQYENIQQQDKHIIKSEEDLDEYEYEQLSDRYTVLTSHKTGIPNLTQSSISTFSYDLEIIKDLIERIENIQLMKYHEKPVEDPFLMDTLIVDDEKRIKTVIESLKQREEHLNYEIKRIEHHKINIEKEIQSIKHQIEQLEYWITVIKTNFDIITSLDEAELMNYEMNLENFRNELEKHKMKLQEHNNEIKSRQRKIEQYHIKIILYEDKINQDKVRRRCVIREHQYDKRELVQKHRAERIEHDITLLRHSIQRIQNELHFTKDDKERREYEIEYFQLCKQLDILYKQQEQYWQISPTYTEVEYNYKIAVLDPHEKEREHLKMIQTIAVMHTVPDTYLVTEQPKYDIFISYAYRDDYLIRRVKNALSQCYSTHVKGYFSSTDIKICLDNTSTAVIAFINRTYELNTICQADLIHIFKRQFPLVLIISDSHFNPTTNWLNLVWHAFNTQKIFLYSPNFENNLRNVLNNAQWNLSSNQTISNTIESITNNRSNRFLGDLHEWTIAYSNPAQVSNYYRQLISDPLRINTDTKLQDIYYKYIRLYFERSNAINLFEKGANENDIRYFIRAYTDTGPFSATLNHHLSANILFYFGPKLYDTVDYQLVKCLIDFVALIIYRQELQLYLFSGTVYRGVVMSEDDLFKYVVGSRIMNTAFLSTSINKEVANVFSGDGQKEFGVICTYVIHNKNNRRTALYIGNMSNVPDECEVLILPFSAFYVENVKRPSNKCGPIEMMLVEIDFDTLENIDTLTYNTQF